MVQLLVRKKGETNGNQEFGVSQWNVGVNRETVFIGLDPDQRYEYKVNVVGAITINYYIRLAGYTEPL